MTSVPNVTAESALYAPPNTEWCATMPSASRDTATASAARAPPLRTANLAAASRESIVFATSTASGATSAAAALSASAYAALATDASSVLSAMSTYAAPSCPSAAAVASAATEGTTATTTGVPMPVAAAMSCAAGFAGTPGADSSASTRIESSG
jgi:hypothetical protein